MAKALWICYFGTALICQWLFYHFPKTFFAFPVNVGLLLFLTVGLWVISREKRFSPFASHLSSLSTTYLLLTLFLGSCLVQGFTNLPVTGTWWFVAVLTALVAHLTLVLFRGLSRPRPYKLRFTLVHAGLLLALSGGFFGAPDTYEWRAIVTKEQPTAEAFDKGGYKTALGETLQLVSSEATFSERGIPQDYTAELRMGKGSTFKLKVNHPHRLSWQDDLYLESINTTGTTDISPYCIVLWVRQPWKYVQWTGIWMLIAGSALLFIQGPFRTGKKGRRRKAT